MTKRKALSRDRVMAAARQRADADGLAAITMRGLAADLGVEAMSLYHHVPSKAALLDGMVEALLAEIDETLGPDNVVEPGTDWRRAIRRRFLAARKVMVRHRWGPGLIGSRPTIPASLYAYYEQILATLLTAGFSYRLAHRALHAFGSMALGFVQELFTPAVAGGSTDVELSSAELDAMAETLPHLTAMVAAEMHDAGDDILGWCDSQAEFEFTLDLILDGLDRARLDVGGEVDPAKPAPAKGR